MNKQEFLAISLPYTLCVLSECDLENRDYQEVCVYGAQHYLDEFVDEFKCDGDVQIPILRPLSDLTKPIEHNGEKFVPKKRILQIGSGKIYNLARLENAIEALCYGYKENRNRTIEEGIPVFMLQKLIEWRFDVAGLIEKGEAVDVNTLSVNPYN